VQELTAAITELEQEEQTTESKGKGRATTPEESSEASSDKEPKSPLFYDASHDHGVFFFVRLYRGLVMHEQDSIKSL
jgi:hypothetical protein